MIRKLIAEMAQLMGITGLEITVVEGERIGRLDADLVYLTVNGSKSLALAYHHELEQIYRGIPCLNLEDRIRSALSNHLPN